MICQQLKESQLSSPFIEQEVRSNYVLKFQISQSQLRGAVESVLTGDLITASYTYRWFDPLLALLSLL